MKTKSITLIIMVSLVVLIYNLYTESSVELEIEKYEGKLKQIGEDWYLNTGEDFFKLILAPLDYLSLNGIELVTKADFSCNGKLEIEEIFVYSINQDSTIVKLRDEKGEQLWEDADILIKTYYTVDPKNCIACQLCVKYCPVEAIEMIKGVAVIDAAKCIACGICTNGNNSTFKGCPVKAISVVE